MVVRAPDNSLAQLRQNRLMESYLAESFWHVGLDGTKAYRIVWLFTKLLRPSEVLRLFAKTGKTLAGPFFGRAFRTLLAI